MTTTFEDRLLTELTATLPESRPARRKRWLPAAAVLTAAGAAAAAITLNSPAYAIEAEPDGSLRVTMNSKDPADVADAETELRQRGVPIELVPSTLDCLGVLDRPPVTPDHPPLTGPPSRDNHPALFAFQNAGEDAFVVRPDVIPAGQVLWVAVADSGQTLATVSAFAADGAPPPQLCG
jgi:hypothetical protein